MRKLRVLAVMHEEFLPPDSLEGIPEKQVHRLRTEYDVVTGLEHLGHDTRALGLADDLTVLRDALAWKPHIVFNLLEEFRAQRTYVPYVLGYLELMGCRYTGCNPTAMLIGDNKPLMKKILRYHRIPMPDFAIFPRNKVVRRPARLAFPLIVKSAGEHGSMGISQASIVHDDDALAERVAFVHAHVGTGALAEEYIEGREVYLGVIGNQRLLTLPIWEINFPKLSDQAPRIATERIKWDPAYQEKIGLDNRQADLSAETAERVRRIAKRAYRLLGISGYCRMDFRLRPDGTPFLLEPNPNPDLAHDDDFARSAAEVGLAYEQLLQRLINLGLRYDPELAG